MTLMSLRILGFLVAVIGLVLLADWLYDRIDFM